MGYFAASVGLRFDVDHPFIRVMLGFFFFFFHQFFSWVLARGLLDQQVDFDLQRTLAPKRRLHSRRFWGLMGSLRSRRCLLRDPEWNARRGDTQPR